MHDLAGCSFKFLPETQEVVLFVFSDEPWQRHTLHLISWLVEVES